MIQAMLIGSSKLGSTSNDATHFWVACRFEECLTVLPFIFFHQTPFQSNQAFYLNSIVERKYIVNMAISSIEKGKSNNRKKIAWIADQVYDLQPPTRCIEETKLVLRAGRSVKRLFVHSASKRIA